MTHFTSSRFWRCYNELSEDLRETADKQYTLLKENPKHPSLQFKKVGRCWSVRVTLSIRALAVEDCGNLVWFWIGDHKEYDRLIKQALIQNSIPTFFWIEKFGQSDSGRDFLQAREDRGEQLASSTWFEMPRGPNVEG